MNNMAILSSKGNFSSFSFANYNIRFMTSPKLERYTKVNKWHEGYLEVMAKYEGLPEEEEYIDLVPIMENLYIDTSVLKTIQEVKIQYE